MSRDDMSLTVEEPIEFFLRDFYTYYYDFPRSKHIVLSLIENTQGVLYVITRFLPPGKSEIEKTVVQQGGYISAYLIEKDDYTHQRVMSNKILNADVDALSGVSPTRLNFLASQISNGEKFKASRRVWRKVEKETLRYMHNAEIQISR